MEETAGVDVQDVEVEGMEDVEVAVEHEVVVVEAEAAVVGWVGDRRRACSAVLPLLSLRLASALRASRSFTWVI